MPRAWAESGSAGLSTSMLAVFAMLALAAVLAGAAVPFYVDAIGTDGMGRLAALPALLALSLLLVYSRQSLLLLIILFRASLDPVFDTSKLSLGGHQIGVGALVNLFVLAIAMLLVMEKPALLPKKPVAIAWLGFLAAAFCGVVISPMGIEAVRSFLAILSYLALFCTAFYFVRSAGDFRKCMRLVILSSLIPAAYVFVEIATGGVHRFDGFRLQSTFPHPNVFAFYLTLVIALTLYMYKTAAEKSQGIRIGLGLYMVYLLGLLLLTQTRSAWGACFVFFAFYGLFFQRRFLIYLVTIPVAVLLIPSVQDRLMDLATGNDVHAQYAKLNSFAWRVLMWESGLQWMRTSNYFLGYGLESFRFYSPEFFPLAGKYNPGAHSVYVQLLFELGVFGLSAFLWLYVRMLAGIRAMARVDKLGAFVCAFLVVNYLVFSFSDNMLGYLSFNWYFWFVIGAAIAVAVRQPAQAAAEPARPANRVPGAVPRGASV